MPCRTPLYGFKSREVNPETGLRSITFSRRKALHPIEVVTAFPCSQCIDCRLDRSREWAIRVGLESSLYQDNSFITLTYDPKFLPANGFLDYDAPVRFMKRLREAHPDVEIRSFGCAEYGENFSRPHYHICLLNFDFSDKKVFKKSKANFGANLRENYIYTSEELSDLWPLGHSSIGSLTLESAGYVARYVTKKITGKAAEKHYIHDFDWRTGEFLYRPTERSVCVSSRRGIGYPWYEIYGQYVRDHDRINFGGKTYPPPKYFDKLTEEKFPDRFEEIKEMRRVSSFRHADKFALEVAQSGQCEALRITTLLNAKELQFKRLQRGIEYG